jgi:hypothetical protein
MVCNGASKGMGLSEKTDQKRLQGCCNKQFDICRPTYNFIICLNTTTNICHKDFVTVFYFD